MGLFRPKHAILDTDPGEDPDEAVALLLGLNSRKLKIDLIVTSDDDGRRAEYARAAVRGMGKKIPVVHGANLGSMKYWVPELGFSASEADKSDDASESIKEVVQKNRKTTYVCLGPLTNLARFLRYAPELSKKLDVLIMGGATNKTSHNFKRDVEAAREVFESGVKKRYVMSDLTNNPYIAVDRNHELYQRVENSSLPEPLKGELKRNYDGFFGILARVKGEKNPVSYLHDPLALSTALGEHFVRYETRKILLDKNGVMKFSKDGKPTVVSTSADYSSFMKFLKKELPF